MEEYRSVPHANDRSGGSVRTLLSSSDASGVRQLWDAYATASRPSQANFRVWTFGDSRIGQ